MITSHPTANQWPTVATAADDKRLATGREPAAGAADSRWYVALSRAWGAALDAQTDRVTSLSQAVGQGSSTSVATVMRLTAESQMFGVLSSSAASVNNSVGQALETLGRRQ